MFRVRTVGSLQCLAAVNSSSSNDDNNISSVHALTPYHIAGEIFAMLPYINMLLYTMA